MGLDGGGLSDESSSADEGLTELVCLGLDFHRVAWRPLIASEGGILAPKSLEFII